MAWVRRYLWSRSAFLTPSWAKPVLPCPLLLAVTVLFLVLRQHYQRGCGDGIIDAALCYKGDRMPYGTFVECAVPDIPPVCGDGNVDAAIGKEREDGVNGEDTDGCCDDCTIPT